MRILVAISELPLGQDPGQDTSIRSRGGDGKSEPGPATAPGTTQQPGAPAGTPAGAPADPMAGCYSQLPLFAGIGLLFYFLMLRPQQKQEKLRKEMLNKLERGDRVVTNSGIHGVVAGIADDTVQVRIDAEGKVKITVDRSAIGRVLRDDAAAKAAAPAKESAKELGKEPGRE